MKKIVISFFVLLLLGIVFGYLWFSYSISNLKTKTPQKHETPLIVDYDKLKKVEELKQPGRPINLQELNFGRENPFLPY